MRDIKRHHLLGKYKQAALQNQIIWNDKQKFWKKHIKPQSRNNIIFTKYDNGIWLLKIELS